MTYGVPIQMSVGQGILEEKVRRHINYVQETYSPMCRPSYIFLTSARSRERSSLLAEEFVKAFKSFSMASIRRTCAETCRNVKRY
jgi:hypothetical protein